MGKCNHFNLKDEIESLYLRNGKIIALRNPLDKRLIATKLRKMEERARAGILSRPINRDNIYYRRKFYRARKQKHWLNNINDISRFGLRFMETHAWTAICKRSLGKYRKIIHSEIEELEWKIAALNKKQPLTDSALHNYVLRNYWNDKAIKQ